MIRGQPQYRNCKKKGRRNIPHISDIEIAQESELPPIAQVTQELEIDAGCLKFYGNYKAKIDNRAALESARPDGKLVLVTAITPNPAGEGETTTTVGGRAAPG